jgi:hypothetical protein
VARYCVKAVLPEGFKHAQVVTKSQKPATQNANKVKLVALWIIHFSSVYDINP